MPQGQIFKAISGFYYVRTKEGEELECRARGVFKFEKKKVKPLVGDWVEVEKISEREGVVKAVLPRQTELLRPPIANVDQAIVVCSLKEPDFQQMPLDRFLVQAEKEGLDIVICLTKHDLVTDENEVEKICTVYEEAGYPVVITSVRTGHGIELLQAYLKDKVSVFAGQSGVGKSSLLNQLLPDLKLQTGEVSRKIGRGRHTTRQVELLLLPQGGQVADTPGFSQLSFQGMEIEELGACFPEISKKSISCRFRGCLHVNEPDCAVREAVESGKMNAERYQHYLQFLQEMKEQKRRY
ncbi:ribosome small subunit-dependent GTPase A [Thermoflavimicrobium dichotomicum]|uniref:Small ribosomal subunit biogenesis GTPase RsgA n=1 Tax=Thermoflavimicrobium dichotomicum TaxID=46223 RepID=A0A1I3STM6_9BACL|nr:ribosome small subunit-dependent GTPase A [Thermoflavimicrobium dichotomicum]SFJ61743.1 ribosome biogenesis GTPase [Thermoflavimicrobium dichotomicum]